MMLIRSATLLTLLIIPSIYMVRKSLGSKRQIRKSFRQEAAG